MAQVIIFDGVDMCGKTNMATALAQALDVPYYKNSIEADQFDIVDDEYFTKASRYIDTYMSDFLRSTGMRVVFDRNYPSEFVYPRVFGRTCDFDMLRKIDDVHASMGTCIVVPYRTTFEGIIDDVHPQITPDRLRELDELYIQFCQWTSCQALRLNVDDEDLTRELAEIMAFLGERR